MNTDEHRWNEVTRRVIGCAMRVSNELGCGFLESVYGNAKEVAMREEGLEFRREERLLVRFAGFVVGEFVADFVVEGCVVVELKAVKALDDAHLAQCLNYLKASNLPLCLLFNFAKPRVVIKRIVLADLAAP